MSSAISSPTPSSARPPSKRCIDTQVERKSRRLFARLIPDKSAPATARAEYDIYKDIPAPARIDRT